MFKIIYSHEVTTWFKKPLFYIFSAIMFVLGGLVMAIAMGVFNTENATITSTTLLNSPIAITALISELSILAYFLIPSITGGTIYRDFKDNMHNVLYSYPLTKWNYLVAKFSAAITINLIIIAAIILGMIVGTYLPGGDESLIGPFKLWNYIQPFLVIIIPNVLFYSAIVFAIVLFTRNMNIGFMTVMGLIILQLIAENMAANVDDKFWYALADPRGSLALADLTEYWTPIEQNEKSIPFIGVLLYNRLIWASIAIVAFLGIVSQFNFEQQARTVSFKKAKGKRAIKENQSSVQKIVMPRASVDFSFKGQLKTLWHLTKNNTAYIIKGWPFIIIGTLAVTLTFVMMAFSSMIYNTSLLPKTWVMLAEPSTYILLFTYLLIHLYSGFLMDRSRAAHMSQIIDVTPTKNWVFMLSKIGALILMVATLQLLLILCGITYQALSGFYDFQIDLYLFQGYLLNIWRYVPWILMALLVHSLIKNKWLGLVVLIVIAVAIPSLQDALGIDQSIFRFNSGGNPSPSDFMGYGSLARYYTFRIYWISFSTLMLLAALLFYRRGTGIPAKERISLAKIRWDKPITITGVIALALFLSIGSYSWYVNNVWNERMTGKEQEELRVNLEKELGKFNGIPQPRTVAVTTNVDFFPDQRDFNASATFTMVNKNDVAIDTLHVALTEYPTQIELNREASIVYDNEDYDYRMYALKEPLQPGDTLEFSFTTHNKPNRFLDNNSPVQTNGTFVNAGQLFPSIGYNDGYEIRDQKIREKYGLAPKDRLPDPDAPGARDNNYIGGYSDWIDFEATLSTSADQIAIAPGYLIKEWEEEDRKYFHYKMDSKMLNFYSFMSGKYAVKREIHNGINLEIYHHPDHTYNLDRMMKGLKEGLEYFSTAFTPYQHKQARIIEFPKRYGSFAQAFANTIPFSEGVGFIADVDDTDTDAVDYSLAITAHELAHQWWAHQVIGAKAKGMTLLSESLSEYSSLKVLERVYGKNQMKRFLKDNMDQYLSGRTRERIKEQPLMFNENQQYIHYRKGSVVLYAISDYLGEDVFNGVAKRFAEKYQFKDAPYPVSTEFVKDIKDVTPDSLQYLVTDMFETITLYDNKVDSATYKELDNGSYAINLKSLVSKYRSYNKGKKNYSDNKRDSLMFAQEKDSIYSLPLADYIEVGVFGEPDEQTGNENVLYLKKIKVEAINNDIEIIVNEQPKEVGIDPFHKLIDRNLIDNRKKVKKEESEVKQAS